MGVEKFRGAGLDLLLLFFVCALISGWMYTRSWTAETRALRAQFVEAQIVSGAGLLPRAGMLSARRAGEPHLAREVLARAQVIDPNAWDAIERLLFFAVVGGGAGGAVLYPFVRGLRRGGGRADKHIRGAQIVPSWRLRARLMFERGRDRLLNRSSAKKPITIAGVALTHHLESVHVIAAGATGVGKSQLIMSMLDAIRERGEKAIITDVGGNLMAALAQKSDRLLNLLDARSVKWSPQAEIREPQDTRSIANSLIPPGEGAAAEWRGYSQTLLSVLLRKLGPNATNADLFRLLAAAGIDELAALAAGTTAARAFENGAERARAGVLFTIGMLSEALEYLPPEAGAGSFSIRKWVEDENEKSWLWLPYEERHAPLLRQVIGAWCDIAISAVLSLRANPNRRVWLVMDELDSAGEVGQFKNALTKGRKYGLCSIVGVQSVSQMRENYGPNTAETILGNLRNLICFNCPDPKTAEYMSERLGNAELARDEESKSEHGSSVSTRRQVQPIVLAGEIQNLRDLSCYLNLAGDYPVTKIRIPYRARPERIKPFILRGKA